MIPRLGVNIDHVATLRNARGEFYPMPIKAAEVCLLSGADQITIHLREDRRHIRDEDVFDVKKITSKFDKPLNLEIGCNEEIIEIAIKAAPDWVCIVPEKREEVTTEGGLNLLDEPTYKKVESTCLKLKASLKNCKISLFVESSTEVLQKAKNLEVDAVEIHTGAYAKDFLEEKPIDHHLKAFAKAKEFLDSVGVKCHAGHGLTDKSTKPLVELGVFEEFNIGHWIVAESVFSGLDNVVKELKELIITR